MGFKQAAVVNRDITKYYKLSDLKMNKLDEPITIRFNKNLIKNVMKNFDDVIKAMMNT